MPAKNYLIKINDAAKKVCLTYNTGNAAIQTAKLKIDLKDTLIDADGMPLQENHPFNLGIGNQLKGKAIVLLCTVAPNPAVLSKELSLSFSLVNARQIGNAKQVLITSDYSNGYALFEITLKII